MYYSMTYIFKRKEGGGEKPLLYLTAGGNVICYAKSRDKYLTALESFHHGCTRPECLDPVGRTKEGGTLFYPPPFPFEVFNLC